MPKFEKYLRLDPSGELSWITIDRYHFLEGLHKAIGCQWVENVRLPGGICAIVDEVGKIKDPPQPVNPLASKLYPGTAYGDPLVGPVVFARIDLVDGESDWCPLLPAQVCMLQSVLGIEIPDEEAAV